MAANVHVYGFGPGATGASAMRVWSNQVVADGTGAWTADYTSAGFTGIPIVVASGVNNTGVLIDQAWSHIQSSTATTTLGTAIRGITLVALGTTIRTAPGVSTNVIALGA